MENKTITRVRLQLSKKQEDFKKMKDQYRIARLNHPFDKYKLDSLRANIRKEQKEIQNLRYELESYQLEFLFGA